MNNKKKGFTLIEMLVVVMIVGILAAFAIPGYFKTVESTKATNAAGTGHMLTSAYRMLRVDNAGIVLSGTMSDSCNTGACSTADVTPCRLVRCKYVTEQPWTAPPAAYRYTFSAAGVVAQRVGASNPSYNRWNYTFDLVGTCTPAATTPNPPACPRF